MFHVVDIKGILSLNLEPSDIIAVFVGCFQANKQ